MSMFPAWLQEMEAWINNPSIYMYGMWDSPTPGDVNGPYGPGVPGEGGVDLGSSQGTPVYALATGKVIASGYWKDKLHGVVTTRVNVPGQGLQDLYYQHINIASGITPGMTVQKGQLIGTVGSLNEVEVGFNANWGYPWQNGKHPGPWVKDPRPWIKSLMLSNAGSSTINQLNNNTITSNDTNTSGNSLTDFTTLLESMNNSGSNTFLGFDFTKFIDASLLFVVGIVLLIIGGMLVMNTGISMPKATIEA